MGVEVCVKNYTLAHYERAEDAMHDKFPIMNNISFDNECLFL